MFELFLEDKIIFDSTDKGFEEYEKLECKIYKNKGKRGN